MKKYGDIGGFRLLDIEVYYEDELVYSGAVENAPDEIKNMKYSKIEMGNPVKIYVYKDEEYID